MPGTYKVCMAIHLPLDNFASPRRASGFTLIEVLVVITVVAVLVALAAPGFVRAKESARVVASQSNVGQLAAVLSVSLGDTKGVYPAIEDGKLVPICDSSFVSYPYWQVFETWPTTVFGILPYCHNQRVFISPGSRRLADGGDVFPTSYWYSTSFAGQPGLWSGSATASMALRRPARDFQVGFPSAKVLLFDSELGWLKYNPKYAGVDLDETSPMAFADGHGAVKKPAMATAAVINPFGVPIGDRRLHNTRDGVMGRDYE